MQAAQGADAQSQVVQAYFNTAPVQTSQQIRESSFYSLLHQGQVLLLFCKSNTATSDDVEMALAITGHDLKPIPRRKLLEFGKQNRLLQLDIKTHKPIAAKPMAADDDLQPPDDAPQRSISEFLANLVPIAKATGLAIDTDAIQYVREHDLPQKQYLAAFNAVNGLYFKMEAQEGQLAQQMKKDEQDFASGALKMTTLEWRRKKQRDTERLSKVSSALRFCRLALDQLNTLVSSG
jgi:hypothetical protein